MVIRIPLLCVIDVDLFMVGGGGGRWTDMAVVYPGGQGGGGQQPPVLSLLRHYPHFWMSCYNFQLVEMYS